MGFFQNTDLWVIFPRQVEIYIKDDLKEDYRLFKTIKDTIPPEANGDIKDNTTDLDGITPKYMKVIAQYYGNLPEWHRAGPENPSMIFADEVVVR